ncbi:MAG: hypothetical protein BWY49_00527 [Candidatus Omnitrophica bacterium ADurb.Bin314]|nr:MAG: hypothetical protein BWY49_00527 [Candidatus Omnitrophica bacterium ADurb.Bin314]
MRHRHLVGHILGAEHALLHFMIEAVIRDRPAGREIDVVRPRVIRELVHRRHFAPREPIPAHRGPRQVLVRHGPHQTEHVILMTHDRLEQGRPSSLERFQIVFRVIHQSETQIIKTARQGFRHCGRFALRGFRRRMTSEIMTPRLKGPGVLRKLRDIPEIQITDVIGLNRLQQTIVLVLLVRGNVRVHAPRQELRTARVVRVGRRHAAVLIIFRDVRERQIPAQFDRLLKVRAAILRHRHATELADREKRAGNILPFLRAPLRVKHKRPVRFHGKIKTRIPREKLRDLELRRTRVDPGARQRPDRGTHLRLRRVDIHRGARPVHIAPEITVSLKLPAQRVRTTDLVKTRHLRVHALATVVIADRKFPRRRVRRLRKFRPQRITDPNEHRTVPFHLVLQHHAVLVDHAIIRTAGASPIETDRHFRKR